MSFQIKRAYDPASPSDGSRILVDRLWPRGVRKSTAHLSDWMKDIAPSPKLRIWFGHREERFAEFRRRYEGELSHNMLVPKLRELGRGQLVTLVYGARDPLINHARVLRDALQGMSSYPMVGSSRRRVRTNDFPTSLFKTKNARSQ
jgi:uncharacterized protein YeaO (DUF488 family)